MAGSGVRTSAWRGNQNFRMAGWRYSVPIGQHGRSTIVELQDTTQVPFRRAVLARVLVSLFGVSPMDRKDTECIRLELGVNTIVEAHRRERLVSTSWHF